MESGVDHSNEDVIEIFLSFEGFFSLDMLRDTSVSPGEVREEEVLELGSEVGCKLEVKSSSKLGEELNCKERLLSDSLGSSLNVIITSIEEIGNDGVSFALGMDIVERI